MGVVGARLTPSTRHDEAGVFAEVSEGDDHVRACQQEKGKGMIQVYDKDKGVVNTA